MNTRSGAYCTNLLRDLQRLAAKAGIDRFTVHLLGHTFAGHHVARGVSLYMVQKWMGHSTIRMTERYAHLAAERDPDIEGPAGEGAASGGPASRVERGGWI